MPTFGLIVTYHFPTSDSDAFTRLTRGLQSLVGQTTPDDRIILVANGTKGGAADPDHVLRDVGASSSAIIPVVIAQNRGCAGGLNVGINAALRTECSYIGPVQSSVVVGHSWLNTLRGAAQGEPTALFGRLVFEDQPDTIFNDGHVQFEGLTLDHNRNKRVSATRSLSTTCFPCLSACVFSRPAVQAVHRHFGGFVTDRLAHYGDCTDAALRCIAVGHSHFRHSHSAIALKRRPTLDRRNVLASQLLAASRYYQSRRDAAYVRIGSKYPSDLRFLDDADQAAYELESDSYSRTGVASPKATKAFDSEWGA